DTFAGERHMRDAAGRGGCLHSIALLEVLESFPQPDASAQEYRDDHDVHVVDEPRGEEIAEHAHTSADADVLALRGLAGGGECLCRRRVDEVKRRSTLH